MGNCCCRGSGGKDEADIEWEKKLPTDDKDEADIEWEKKLPTDYKDEADIEWEKKLPTDYKEILAKADLPVNYKSKEELYHKLCDSILIEGRTQRIWLDKSIGKLAYMLSARALEITWGNDNRYWSWVSNEESRFDEVAELKLVWWFEVTKKINCSLLAPNTEYSVAFVLKIDKTKGKSQSHPSPFTFSLKRIDGELIKSARFLDDLDKSIEGDEHELTPVITGEKGWMEFVVGNFFLKEDDNDIDTKDIEVCMKNKDGYFPKNGIVIDGVKISPKMEQSTTMGTIRS